jgi:DNA mismatch repair protein MutL
MVTSRGNGIDASCHKAAAVGGALPRKRRHRRRLYDRAMAIRKLPPLLVNQIAAGEVIERPASVVKELIENSIDAGAAHIDVTVEDGGATLIKVADDGRGIPADELPLAVAPHATSKLQTADQLAAIHTLGFRGEALASIASVSRMIVTSRTGGGEPGFTLDASGETVGEPKPAGVAPGTTIEVRDLFFNTPARRKFLRTPATEIGHIGDTVSRVAMVHPHIGFTLRHGPRLSLDLPAAADDPRRRCIDVLGQDLDEALLDMDHEDTMAAARGRPAVRVWGLLGLPSLARATAKHQYLAVNGRIVRDRNLGHAIKEAYRGLIPPDRHPVMVAMIWMDAEAVDVNVHPTKAEVRFGNPSAVHGTLLTAMRQALLRADLTPTLPMPAPGTSGVAGAAHDASGLGGLLQPAGGGADATPASGEVNPSAFVEYFKNMAPTQRTMVYSEMREAMADEGDGDATLPVADGDGGDASGGGSGGGGGVRPREVLQVHDSYVVTQDGDGLLIVDQHALHERVMYETLRRRVLQQDQPLESQRLLMPAVVDLPADRLALLEPLAPLLARIGVDAQPVGPRQAAVHAFPTLLFDRRVEPGAFLTDLLDLAEAGELNLDTLGGDHDQDAAALESAMHPVLDMMACKAAVKAGDPLTDQELEALLARRGEVERSSNCPHGRPTTLRLSMGELAKRFGRT